MTDDAAHRTAVDDSRESGRALRQQVPRSVHGEWVPAADRSDPVTVIEGQNADRVPRLVPLRRGRMSASAFSFYRGTAAVMAADLAATPTPGLTVQLCGDAHLANFGVYASPERQLVFDVNDFDETLPGPFEWDVKRLAASFCIAARHRGFPEDVQRDLAEHVTRSYRQSIRRLADAGWLAAWYDQLDQGDLEDYLSAQGTKRQLKRLRKAAAKARSRDTAQAFNKLVDVDRGAPRFKHRPPALVPLRELPEVEDGGRARELVDAAFRDYRASLDAQTRWLVDRYHRTDTAMKVVGVGSVGTRCWVGLFTGRRPDDVLLLQVKEAGPSVLEHHLAASRYQLHGRRVVEGQRLMQAASDVFLGWCSTKNGRHYYWRQFRDWKGSLNLDKVRPSGLERYAEICGYTLARAHAVSGDPAAIAGYLGRGSVFDRAIGEFSVRYADQTRADHADFSRAIADGLPTET